MWKVSGITTTQLLIANIRMFTLGQLFPILQSGTRHVSRYYYWSNRVIATRLYTVTRSRQRWKKDHLERFFVYPFHTWPFLLQIRLWLRVVSGNVNDPPRAVVTLKKKH